jgi:hypothetical protein
LTGKVLLSAIRTQALNLLSGLVLHEPFQVLEAVEDFTLPLNEVDPCVPCVVVDEGNKVSASAKTNVLRLPPYVGMYQIELVSAPITLVWERKSVLLPELAGFTHLCLAATKFGQTKNHMFRLQILKPSKVDVAYPLVPQVDIRLGFLFFHEQSSVRAVVGTVKDKHPPVSASSRNDSAFLLDEGSEVRKPDLNPLVDDYTSNPLYQQSRASSPRLPLLSEGSGLLSASL